MNHSDIPMGRKQADPPMREKTACRYPRSSPAAWSALTATTITEITTTTTTTTAATTTATGTAGTGGAGTTKHCTKRTAPPGACSVGGAVRLLDETLFYVVFGVQLGCASEVIQEVALALPLSVDHSCCLSVGVGGMVQFGAQR